MDRKVMIRTIKAIRVECGQEFDRHAEREYHSLLA